MKIYSSCIFEYFKGQFLGSGFWGDLGDLALSTLSMTVARCCVQDRDWKSSMQSREDTEWGSTRWMVLGDVAMPKTNIRGSCSTYRLRAHAHTHTHTIKKRHIRDKEGGVCKRNCKDTKEGVTGRSSRPA